MNDLSAVLKSIFQEGGWLEDTLDFEHRSEQFKMAKGSEKALLTEDHLLFEAGTGVGKSLAYLIPSILFAIHRKRTCVVATNTISLQEQLLNIPAVRFLFESIPSRKTLKIFAVLYLLGGQIICVQIVCSVL